jgi:hypothetical protein
MPGHDIIVLDASLGGVETLSKMVSGLPHDLPAAVFVVLWIAPSLYERMIARRAPKDHFTNIQTSPTKGNLFEPMLEWVGTRGGWRNPELDARRRRVTVGTLAGVAAMGLAFMMWRRRGNRASEDSGQQAAPIASRNLLRMGQS